MDAIRSILVGVDFSKSSHGAAKQAQRLAGWSKASVGAVCAVEPLAFMPADPLFGLPAMSDLAGTVLADARESWKRWTQEDPTLEKVPFEAVLGSPAYELPHRARQNKVGLIVIGTSGRVTHPEGMGPTAASVVRRSPCPVLAVREGHSGVFRRVVACTDFSSTSLEALRAAVRIATQDNAELHVLHVFDPPWRAAKKSPGSPMESEEFRAKYRGALEAHSRAFSKPLEHELGYLKASFEAYENESHGRGIARFVREKQGDLVVLGTRGASNIRDMVIGSTAERVIRHAPCSVLTVPPKG